VAADQLPHQALLAVIDAALQAEFLRLGCVVHNTGRKAVQQVGGAAQVLRGEVAEDAGELPVFRRIVGGQHPAAGGGEGKLDGAAVRLGFIAKQQAPADELVHGLAGGRVAYAEKCRHIADRLRIR